METIVEKFILQLEAQLAERKVAFTLVAGGPRLAGAKKGFDPVYGARPLARVIQQEVRNPLTDEILFGRLENGGHVRIGLAGDAPHVRFRLRCAASHRDTDARRCTSLTAVGPRFLSASLCHRCLCG